MAGSSRKDFECIATGYPLRDYQVCSTSAPLSERYSSNPLILILIFIIGEALNICCCFFQLRDEFLRDSKTISNQTWLNITKTRLFKYVENFTTKNKVFRKKKKSDIFSYFCPKHILWGGSNEYPQFMFLSRNKEKIMYTPVNLSFTI